MILAASTNSELHAYKGIVPALFLREERNIDRVVDGGKMTGTRWRRRGLYPGRASASRALFWKYADPPRYRLPGGPFWAPTACRRRRIWLPGLQRPGENTKKEWSREKEGERRDQERVRPWRELNLSAKLRSRASVFAMSRFNLIIRTSWIERLTWYTRLLLNVVTLDDCGTG